MNCASAKKLQVLVLTMCSSQSVKVPETSLEWSQVDVKGVAEPCTIYQLLSKTDTIGEAYA